MTIDTYNMASVFRLSSLRRIHIGSSSCVLIIMILPVVFCHGVFATEKENSGHGSEVELTRFIRDEASAVDVSSNSEKVNTGGASDNSNAGSATSNDGDKAGQMETNSATALNRNETCTPEANSTTCDNTYGVTGLKNTLYENSGMLFRAMFVLLGVTGIVVVYFVVKAVTLRKRRSKSRKYGIVSQHGDSRDMEMEPLGDGDDEDDDYTVFEANGRHK